MWLVSKSLHHRSSARLIPCGPTKLVGVTPYFIAEARLKIGGFPTNSIGAHDNLRAMAAFR